MIVTDAEPGEPGSQAKSAPGPVPGLYRHCKGGLYTVICVGRHSETEEWLVTYRAEADGSFWIRPLDMWNELVPREGRSVPRFVPVGAPPAKPA